MRTYLDDPFYVEPESVEEADRRIDDKGQEIQDIQDQLSNAATIHADGTPLTPREFAAQHEWKRRAKSAIRHKQRERDRLKEWATAHREPPGHPGAPGIKHVRRKAGWEIERAILQALLAVLIGSDDEKLMAVEGILQALNLLDVAAAADEGKVAVSGNGNAA